MMQTLQQWREEKRRQAKAKWLRQQSGRCVALFGLILTFLAVPLAGPIQAGLICMGLTVFIAGLWWGFAP